MVLCVHAPFMQTELCALPAIFMAQFPMSHGPIPGRNLGVGEPALKYLKGIYLFTCDQYLLLVTSPCNFPSKVFQKPLPLPCSGAERKWLPQGHPVRFMLEAELELLVS